MYVFLLFCSFFFFFKQKTAYEMRISDWSSDVCSSDLGVALGVGQRHRARLRRDQADQALVELHAGLVHGGRLQAFGGKELQHIAVAHEVDRADLRDNILGDQVDHLVEPRLARAAALHQVAQQTEQPARTRPAVVDTGRHVHAASPRASLRLALRRIAPATTRSEEHTSELQSLMRISYAVFCLNKKTQVIQPNT